MRTAFALLFIFLTTAACIQAVDKISLSNDTCIVLLGGGQGARMVEDPSFETAVYQRFATHNLIIRNMCDDGDTPAYRPHPGRSEPYAFPGAERFYPLPAVNDKWGSINFGKGEAETPDQWLQRVETDVIIGLFGYSESFAGPDGVAAFTDELTAWVKHTAQQKYNGQTAPVVVLVTPPAIEDRSQDIGTPDGVATNGNIKLYSDAIAVVAQAHGLLCIDAFSASQQWYASNEPPLTRDGWAYNAHGHSILGHFLAESIFSSGNRQESYVDGIADAVLEKNWLWKNWYKIPNGVHVHGRRHKPYGPDNYPHELIKLEEMVALRDQAIWAAAHGKTFDLAAADAKTHKMPTIETNYKPQGGPSKYLYGNEATATIAVPDGYQIELFASEKDFPNLANPVQLGFDNAGRLWVATMPTYPHWQPGDPKPDDKLIILEDTNNDGKADKEIVFADGLHLPIGFEFVPGGVYVSQGKELLFLRDEDGDDYAEVREFVLGGFDDHDTHHAVGAFTADPSGAFYLSEGTFLHSHVETAYGPIRSSGGGFYRFSPQTQELEKTARVSIPNPWGIAVDRYGQEFFSVTSNPALHWLSPSTMQVPFGHLAPLTTSLTPKPGGCRPCSGMEFVSSRHFPDDVQGDMLLNNTIGFLGTRQHQVSESGTGYQLNHRHNLLESTDGNFRPVDCEFAPDGSLYVVDWHNVLIGHKQHSARDPLRDHVHGRIYRVTYPSRPLVEPARVVDASIDTLFDNLMLPEYRTRYRSRRELRGRPVADVLAGLKRYTQRVSTSTGEHEHHLLEGLWVSWGMQHVDVPLLKQLLQAKDHRIRAAAVRVLRYTSNQVADSQALLLAAANDQHGRVRIEAVNASSWMDKEFALAVLNAAKQHPQDNWLKPGFAATEAFLTGTALAAEENTVSVPKHLKRKSAALYTLGAEVYARDGHCASCHQPDGEGLPDAGFPPLAGTKWVQGSPERLISLTLHGLLGPMEVKGKQYTGHVPMTPFKNLSDEEIAAVLTYVRNSFGNKASPINAKTVSKVRKATARQEGFYSPAELLEKYPD